MTALLQLSSIFGNDAAEEAKRPANPRKKPYVRKKKPFKPENTPKHNVGRNIRSDERTAKMAKATFYVIGDVHGRSDLLRMLMKNIDKDKVKKKRRYKPSVIFIGDIVDNGPDSKGAMDIVAEELQRNPGKSRLLLGNHDEWLLNFLNDRQDAQTNYHWIYEAGGYTTPASYGFLLPDKDEYKSNKDAFEVGMLRFAKKFLSEHSSHKRALQQAIKGGLQIGNVIFAHAGLEARGKPLGAQNTRMMRWVREEFLYDGADDGKLVVHGHSFARGGVPNVRQNRINIDTVAKNLLTCLVIDPARSSLTFYQASSTGVRELQPGEINVKG